MIGLSRGTWTWGSSTTVKAAFVRTDYSFNQDTPEFWSEVKSFESWSNGGAGDTTVGGSGSGLPQGGTALANKSVSYNASTNTTSLDADDLVLPGVTHSNLGGIILYGVGATEATSPLIAYINLSDVGQTNYQNVTLTVAWSSSGLVQLPVAE